MKDESDFAKAVLVMEEDLKSAMKIAEQWKQNHLVCVLSAILASIEFCKAGEIDLGLTLMKNLADKTFELAVEIVNSRKH